MLNDEQYSGATHSIFESHDPLERDLLSCGTTHSTYHNLGSTVGGVIIDGCVFSYGNFLPLPPPPLAEATGLGFVCFVVNSCVLSASRVDLGFFVS